MRFTVPTIAVVMIVADGLVPSTGSGATAETAVRGLNALRAAAGLPANVFEVPEWSARCAAHVTYMGLNGLVHEEAAGSRGYTAEGAWAGARAILADRGSFVADGDNPWMTAPLHLNQILQPRLRAVGYADGAGGACMTTWPGVSRTAWSAAIFTYPGDGQTRVPTSVDTCLERPTSPAREVGLDCHTAGPDLHVLVTGAVRPSLTAASLTGPEGAVRLRAIDGRSRVANLMSDGAILIPERALRPGARYRATVVIAGMRRTWTFRTAMR